MSKSFHYIFFKSLCKILNTIINKDALSISVPVVYLGVSFHFLWKYFIMFGDYYTFAINTSYQTFD